MADRFEAFDIAKCLISLSHIPQNNRKRSSSDDVVFECKTCNRTFPSFQALGGHRSSHKRPRLTIADKINHINGDNKTALLGLTMKPKIHECSICGQGFSMGQALGGHMKHHRAAAMKVGNINGSVLFSSSVPKTTVVSNKLPELRRMNSSKRVFGLDLNLTPLENDLEFLFGKMAPKVNLVL